VPRFAGIHHFSFGDAAAWRTSLVKKKKKKKKKKREKKRGIKEYLNIDFGYRQRITKLRCITRRSMVTRKWWHSCCSMDATLVSATAAESPRSTSPRNMAGKTLHTRDRFSLFADRMPRIRVARSRAIGGVRFIERDVCRFRSLAVADIDVIVMLLTDWKPWSCSCGRIPS